MSCRRTLFPPTEPMITKKTAMPPDALHSASRGL